MVANDGYALPWEMARSSRTARPCSKRPQQAHVRVDLFQSGVTLNLGSVLSLIVYGS